MTRSRLPVVPAILLALACFSHPVGAQQEQARQADLTRRAALISVSRPGESPQADAPPAISVDAAWKREIATHAVMLAHGATFAAALSDQKSPIRATGWFAAQADDTNARAWLRDHLRADPVPSTRLIRVYFEPTPESSADEKIMLEAIVDSYISEQAKTTQAAVLDRVQALTTLKTKFEIRIRELSDRQNNLMLRMQMGEVGTPNTYTTTDLALRETMRRQADQRSAAAAAHGKHNALKAEFDAGIDPVELVRWLNSDQEITTIRTRIGDLEAEIAGATAGSDAVAAKMLQAKRDAYVGQLEKVWKQKRDACWKALFAQAESDASSADASLNLLDKRLGSLQNVLGDLAIAMSDYLSTRDELALTRAAATRTHDQLDRIQSSMTEPAVRWAQHPQFGEK